MEAILDLLVILVQRVLYDLFSYRKTAIYCSKQIMVFVQVVSIIYSDNDTIFLARSIVTGRSCRSSSGNSSICSSCLSWKFST